MQILCYKESLDIITYTYDKWNTYGEFTNPEFACIEIECSVNNKPVNVISLGEPTEIIIQGEEGLIYRDSSVVFDSVQEII